MAHDLLPTLVTLLYMGITMYYNICALQYASIMHTVDQKQLHCPRNDLTSRSKLDSESPEGDPALGPYPPGNTIMCFLT